MSSGITYEPNSIDESEVGKYASQLPKPVGYTMLLALPDPKDKTNGGIVIPEARLSEERAASVVGMVLFQGPDCYSDKKRFPSGAWCKEGDWVVIRSYAGNRVLLHGKEFRLISDDGIEAVVEDPSGLARVSGA